MRFTRNLFLLLCPYLVMILINEAVRPSIKEPPYQSHGITTINSNLRLQDKCTWVAHNNTNYCKEHHVKFLKPYYIITDPIYFGVISLLRSTGNYGAANIVLLVILFPLIMWYSLVKIIDYWIEIRRLKKV